MGKPKLRTVKRYYLFVGCADPTCLEDHGHDEVGWETMATSSDDLEAIRAVAFELDACWWWQIVDLVADGLIMRSTDGEGSTHH